MTNHQLKAHCEDVIANPQDHLDWVVDMARVALASLEAPQELEISALLHAARYLRNRYICNEGDGCEFIACVTPNKRSIGTGNEWDNWRLLAAAIDAFPSAPPLPELKPIELPHKLVAYVDTGELVTEIDDENGTYMEAAEVIDFIRAAGYEVKA